MSVGADVARYLAAAGVDALPNDVATPRYRARSKLQLEELRRRTDLATTIWCSAPDDASRLEALAAMADDTPELPAVRTMLHRQLGENHRRLPRSEIAHALAELGLADADNGVLSAAETRALDREGYVNLGRLLDTAQLGRLRARLDAEIEREGSHAGSEVSRMHGIGRLSGTVLKAMNGNGLFDAFFMEARLLAAVRHVLGVGFKMSSSNFHCPLPGFGRQALHADWGWGVREPEVVNAIWLLDDFHDANGPTRVVPGSHRSGQHPNGSAFNDGRRDPHDAAVGEVHLTGAAGSCIVYNAHLWHGGTQNRSTALRRALHSFFTRSERRSQTDALALLHPNVRQRLSRTQRAILDVP